MTPEQTMLARMLLAIFTLIGGIAAVDVCQSFSNLTSVNCGRSGVTNIFVASTLNATLSAINVTTFTGTSPFFQNLDAKLYSPTTIASDSATFFNSGTCSGNTNSNFSLQFFGSGTSYVSTQCPALNNSQTVLANPASAGGFSPVIGKTALGSWRLQMTVSIYPNTAQNPPTFVTGTTLNLCATQQTMTLNIDASSVTAGSGSFSFFLSTSSGSITSNVTLTCGANPPVFALYNINATATARAFVYPTNYAGSCTLVATAPYNSPVYSPASTIFTINIAVALTVSSPIANGGTFSALASSQFTGAKVLTLKVLTVMGQTVQTYSLNLNQNTTFSITVPSAGNYVFLTMADASASVSASNTVTREITGYFPVYLTLVTLTPNPAVGGSNLTLEIAASNSSTPTIGLLITCPSSSASFSGFVVGSVQQITLPDSLSGINCVLTTTDVPNGYVALTPFTFSINLSSSRATALLQSMNLGAFLNYKDKRSDVDQQSTDQKSFKTSRKSRIQSQISRSKASRSKQIQSRRSAASVKSTSSADKTVDLPSRPNLFLKARLQQQTKKINIRRRKEQSRRRTVLKSVQNQLKRIKSRK